MKEIERRWLVSAENAVQQITKSNVTEQIKQAYVFHDSENVARVRFSCIRSKDAKIIAYFTIKRPGNNEFETEVNYDFAKELYDASNLVIEKTRYHITHGFDLIYFTSTKVELDVFSGNHVGLIIAEVEFASEEAAANFKPLDWFGKEITGMKEYSNYGLASSSKIP